MAYSLSPNATVDEIEEELEFKQVLITSLDIGADDFPQRYSELEAEKNELERRLDALQSASRPQTAPSLNHMNAMDGSQDMNGDAWWQATLNGRPGSSASPNGNSVYGGSYHPHPHPLKRQLAPSSQYSSQHPSKRPTPEPSQAGTPASSNDSSFEWIENPNAELTERIRLRQATAEAVLQRQREAQAADERLARSLQQDQVARPHGFASPSLGPGVQTTLNHTGSYQRPPSLVKPESLTLPSTSHSSHSHPPNTYANTIQPQQNQYIKPEPSPSTQRSLVERPRHRVPQVIDLTNSDDEDEDEDVTITASNNRVPDYRIPPALNSFTGYNLPGQTMPNYPQLQQQGLQPTAMPGSYPTITQNANQPVYGSTPNNLQRRYPWMQPQQPQSLPSQSLPSQMQQQQLLQQQQSPLLTRAFNGVRNIAGDLSDTIGQLGNLINPTQQQFHDDSDDDIVYGGSRQVQPGQRAYAGYDDHDLYQRRYDAFANYDPLKTQEEINSLLETIRPDEDMPAHLRVQTPESMNVTLHKYQELGLTWLQRCEDGHTKGGILADDMGLGKTIQMLSLIVTHKSEDPRCKTTLIVAPVALMRQWEQEIEQKVKPGSRYRLSVFVQHGQSKKKSFRQLQHYDIVLTTFGSLAAELKKLEKFHLRKVQNPDARPYESEKCALIDPEAEWYRVILDEAQCIKNTKTQTAKAACYLKTKYRFCMTGTPMMNNVDEFYSLVKFLRIKPYHEWTRFRRDISQPLKSSHEHTRQKAMTMLQTVCKATMLRRTKTSTYEGKPILVLPERTTEVANPEFSEDEQTFYDALENRTQLQFNRYLQRGTVGSSYSAILVLLLRLRQACCHPHLIKDFGVSAAADVAPEDLITLAKELSPQVVTRIRETNGNFECPVCYDAVINPAIFLPCGHDTCSECFAKIADPSNAIRNGDDNAGGAKCPNCRSNIDPKRITDFESFKKVHMPELLSAEEHDELKQLQGMFEFNDDSETESDDSETESGDEDDEIDVNGNLKNFIVKDGEQDSETESEAEEDNLIEAEGVAGPSKKVSNSKDKGKQNKKSKKGKGKGKKKEKAEKKKQAKAVTLAELKKLASRSASARRAYLRRLRNDWITSAKIEKTMETLKEIMANPEGEKVLIFSQWTSLLDLLEVPVDSEGWGYRRYDGSMNAKMRADAVDDFRDHHKDVRIMLVSLKAGNAGLNLNSASQVIILDPFWNPYIEEQAIDRAHRLGQTRPVKVHRMLIQGTVEDRIIALQEKKRALISEALDEKASQNIGRLGVQELAYLFGVTRNPSQRVQYTPRDARA